MYTIYNTYVLFKGQRDRMLLSKTEGQFEMWS